MKTLKTFFIELNGEVIDSQQSFGELNRIPFSFNIGFDIQLERLEHSEDKLELVRWSSEDNKRVVLRSN